MIDNVIGDFWESLQKIFGTLEKINSINGDSISPSIGRTANDFFLLRAFIAYASENDELSISVDIQSCNDGVIITSDICLENGEIIAEGPTMNLGKLSNEKVITINLKKWESLFKKFIFDNSEKINEVNLK